MGEPHDLIQRTINATALLGIFEDVRWRQYIVPILAKAETSARTRAERSRRDPGLDTAFKAAFEEGQVVALEHLRRTFERLELQSRTIVSEAQTHLAKAPDIPDTPAPQPAPLPTL